jgi:hypothetical protein
MEAHQAVRCSIRLSRARPLRGRDWPVPSPVDRPKRLSASRGSTISVSAGVERTREFVTLGPNPGLTCAGRYEQPR